ncbi:exopolysaccharide biosynthesis polyprenyl glycosylphosphotransferase [Parasedimentitalea maritima]|uniref:Exopolysaccharide biosynthesis polyprenyl glycosylphosphotransferase n=1 Tax=Parasedimentitalea maritima TaxID=2578117 RepID=A0A6A4RHG0_9RHOB|nr:exopolysaccharide biosynthesis polyprenyl glycosylphosphotransferase [Zongyanglinia marina]KAE9628326.1 exopolysaccharide biosynthesis polyprenyl glycosylphosphotransferase [Zongyanglinia marina]
MTSAGGHAVKLNEASQNVAFGLQRGALEPLWLTCVAACIDLPVFTLAFWFALYGSTSIDGFAPLIVGGWAGLGAVLFVTIMAITNGYSSALMTDRASFIARSVLCVIAPVIGLISLAPIESHGLAFSAAVISLAIAIVPTRFGAQVIVRWVVETGLIARRAVIAGGGEEAACLIRSLGDRQVNDIRLYGIFDDRDDTRSPKQILGIPKIGGYEDLVAFVRSSEIDLVIVTLPFTAEKRIKWLLDEFRVLPVEVGLSNYSKDYTFSPSGQAAFMRKLERSFSPKCRLIKRLFDVFFALCALAVLWPVLLVAALAVRFDSPGPIMFRQLRHGYNNRIIEITKFRTMYAEKSDPLAKQVVVKGDPRVTRVGRFLRRSSIDELPQLFNVLRGDLSLVGPRPHAVEAVSSQHERFTQIIEGYSARHRLPPGITGWAQINGWRGEIDEAQKLVERFEHDLFYIENWSFWLDVKILFRTPLSLFHSKGAY